jgi:hypothetical protein
MGRHLPARGRASSLLAAALAALAATVAPAAAQIRINELLPNPFGNDVGTERIEIYNAGATPIDVTGWAIDDAATFNDTSVRARLPEDFDTSACPSSPILLPGEFRVIKGTSTAAFLNNTGDDVYLITDRTSVPPPVVHQVTYGATVEGSGWAAIPNGSSNFSWQPPSMCASNGGGGDLTPPATVADLAAVPGAFAGEVRLTWTAPGDDGATGTASEYRIRVAKAPITAGTFDAAIDLEHWINEPFPSAGGTAEQWTVFGLSPDTTYYFALVAIDGASNASGVSNSPGTPPLGGALPDPDLGYQVYYGYLHSHTGYSDGVQTPDLAYAFARDTAPTPLDFLAVTDHNHVSAGMQLSNYPLGLAAAAAANADGQFVAIYGQEWGLAANGHVNIFESEDLFGWDPGQYDVFVAEGDYASLYSAILANPPASYPPIAEWCHPAASDFNSFQVTADGKAVVHLIALVNGPAQSVATDESDVGNTNFDAVFGQALRSGYRVSPTADQDNHNATWGASTQSRTAVLANAKTKSAILGALAVGRNYASMDHNTKVDFWAEGHAMGEAFVAGAGIRIAARVTDPDLGDSPTTIELFRGITGTAAASRIAFNHGNPEFRWREQQTFATGTEAHYYLRVTMNGVRSVWTGPVYVTYDPSIPTAVLEPPAGALELRAPYPNPGHGQVAVAFVLPRASARVRLGIFDLAGRRIRSLLDRPLEAGEHTIAWNGLTDSGRRAQAGVYFARLETLESSLSRKVLRLD